MWPWLFLCDNYDDKKKEMIAKRQGIMPQVLWCKLLMSSKLP